MTNTLTVPLIIGGKEVFEGKSFEVINPKTGKPAWSCHGVTSQDATKAVEAAQAALKEWSSTTLAARRDLFLKAAEIMKRREEEMKVYMAEETGASEAWVAFNINSAIGMLKDIAGRVLSIEGKLLSTMDSNRSALISMDPFGVVLGIAPWNAAYILGLRAFIYPLAAGNTVVLKGSELSPRSFWVLGSILNEAGLVPGALNVICHDAKDAAAITTDLIANPSVRKINFTGSTMIGSIIAQTAAKYVKPVLMELGGKNCAVVLKDADLKVAAHEVALGANLHGGQICMSTDRVLVHRSIVALFTDHLVTATNEISGPDGSMQLASIAGAQKVTRLVDDAISKGAVLKKTGPSESSRPSATSTTTNLPPMIVEGVTPAMDLYKQESFGPQVSILVFDEEDEAVKVANNTEYGLSAAVFTRDLAAGLRVAKQIQSGAVHINSMTVHDEPGLPHGGTKSSGYGRFNSTWGIQEFLQSKTITFAL